MGRSGRRVLAVGAVILALAAAYMGAISAPVKQAAKDRRRAVAEGARPRAERVRAPTAATPLPAVSTQVSLTNAWADPRAARAFDGLRDGARVLERPEASVAPGVDSERWWNDFMRAPYDEIDATPGERTKGDASLRDYRRELDALFAALARGAIAPAEALIRYRELERQRLERDREVFGVERAALLARQRDLAYESGR